ncbi:MAG: GFA family protein [Dokdonella sp.]
MIYSGGCHCGRIAFDVDAKIDKVIQCNCSLCSKRGYLLAFVSASQLHLRTPEADMTTYTFNKHKIHHLFCPVCGVAPLGRSGDGVAINVRCLDDFDMTNIEIQAFDGRSL